MRLLPRLFTLTVSTCMAAALLLGGATAQAQGLVGPWDLVESGDAQGPTAGTMTLSSNGEVMFAGAPSIWQPNDQTLQFTVMGKMQLPVSEVEMRLSGTTLQGTMLVHSYRRNGNTLEPTSRKRFPISARRPEGFIDPQAAAKASASAQASAVAAPNAGSGSDKPANTTARIAAGPAAGAAAGVAVATAGGSTAGSAGPPAAGQRRMGPDQPEAVALCWENRRVAGKFTCDGPVQLLSISEPLEKALELVGCPSPRGTDGSRTVNNRESMVYLCGYGLVETDRDMARRHGITVQRNVYRCSGSSSKYRCKENYQNMN